MTESVSDPGRDDVLSQVRRLVSAVPPETSKPAHRDRLLLTPALRVPDPSGAPQTDPPAQSRAMSLEERIAELEAAVGGQAQDWEPDGSEGIEPHQPDAVIYKPSTQEDVDPAEASEPASLTDPEEPSEAQAAASADEAPQTDDTAVAADVEPSSPEDEAPHIEVEDTASEDYPETAELAEIPVFSRAEREGAKPVDLPADEDKFPLTAALADTDSVAEAEAPLTEDASVSNAPESDQQDDDPDAAMSGLFLSRHESTQADVEDTVGDEAADLEVPVAEEPDGEDIAAEASVDTPTAEASVWAEPDEEPVADETAIPELDDAQMKALVRQVLLDELTGPLGEKMTRNIRRMVRREVERALSLREFD